MTTTTNSVPLPVGAVSADERESNDGHGYYRSFWGEIRETPTDNRFGEPIVGVYTYGTQHDDGSIDTAPPDRVFGPPAFRLIPAAIRAGWSRPSDSARKQLVNSLTIW